MRLVQTVRASRRVPLLQVTKTAIAMVAAWFVTSWIFPGQFPVFAAIAALLVVQPSVNQSLGKAIERSLGVVLGVVVALGISLAFGDIGWVILLAMVVAIFVSWLLRLTPGSANQVPISAMLVLSIGAHTPGYALERIVETVIGAAIAFVVNVAIVPPVLLAPAHQSVVRLALELAASLERIAAALSAPQTPEQLQELLVTTRLLRPMQQKAQAALTEGEESLTLNPRRSRHRRVLEQDAALFERLVPLVTRTLGMTRAVRDHYDDTLHEEPEVRAIAGQLERAAHDLRLLARTRAGRAPGEPPPVTETVPVLTAPLRIAEPPEHWMLIGSLLEDLRRVREQIVGEG